MRQRHARPIKLVLCHSSSLNQQRHGTTHSIHPLGLCYRNTRCRSADALPTSSSVAERRSYDTEALAAMHPHATRAWGRADGDDMWHVLYLMNDTKLPY
jgi:hypothetical protein